LALGSTMDQLGKKQIEILPGMYKGSKCLISNTGNNALTNGAIIYYTGGIFIDNGWIRILGSGNNN